MCGSITSQKSNVDGIYKVPNQTVGTSFVHGYVHACANSKEYWLQPVEMHMMYVYRHAH